MTLKNLTEGATAQIEETVTASLTEADIKAISKIIEGALIEAVRETTKRCSTAAVVCCGPEADIAHKIAEEVSRARHALIANLMGPH